MTTIIAPSQLVRRRPRSRARSGRAMFYAGAILLVLLIAYAIFVPLLAPSSATRIDLANRLADPTLTAFGWLGRDHLGRELVVTIALGLRTSMVIASLSVLIGGGVGVAVGLCGGYFGGKVDAVCARTMDLFAAFPGLLLGIALMTALGPGVSNVIFVLALSAWEPFARVVRVEAMSLRRAKFVDAARLCGTSTVKVLWTHIGRNVVPLIVSLCIVMLPRTVLAEATMSFLGYGIQPPQYSLGTIISEERVFLAVSPITATAPGVALTALAMAVALIGLGRNLRMEK